MRLDQAAAQKWPEYSRSVWQKYISLGYVSVNGVVQTSTKLEIKPEDQLEANLPDKIDHSERTLPILYQDDNVIVINKPVGVLTHSKGQLNDEFTVAEFMRTRTSYHSDSDRPGIIHRLDRDTSGVIICPRNDETASMLARQFQDRRAKKTYYAIVEGIPKELSATIDVPIARNPSKPSTFRPDPNGKSAQTFYEVEKVVGNSCLIRLQPTTGRTHQLRVHMAYLGTPIRGDKVYGKAGERMMLHAHKLEITIPTSNRTTFEAPLPPDFVMEKS